MNVAEKYLHINVSGREHKVSQILGRKLRAGSLSGAVIDEVNEFALLQKVYIIMRLGFILDISEEDYNRDLLDSIPETYLNIMFGPEEDIYDEIRYSELFSEISPAYNGLQRSSGKTKRDTAVESGPAMDERSLLNVAFYLYQR